MCTKTGLIRSLSSYYRKIPEAIDANYTCFETMATSFIINVGVFEDVEYLSFIQRFKEI